MKDFNVLITGCSAFTKEIIGCLKDNHSGVKIGVVGVNCNSDELLRINVDYPYVVSPFTSPKYVDELISLCVLHDVKVVLPYLTKELSILAANKNKFDEKGIKVSVMDSEPLAIANDKIKLAERFSKYMPKQVIVTGTDDIEQLAREVGYPGEFCCKLNIGSGGQGFAIIDDSKANDINLFGRTGNKRYITFSHLCKLVKSTDSPVILQEHKKGFDYSVCMLCNNGEVFTMIGYIGYAMENGAVMRGKALKHEKAYSIAKGVAKDLNLDGNICIDFIIDDDEATMLEVNPRLNATVGLCKQAGVNLPYLRCLQLLGESFGIPNERYGIRMNRYYESEYFA